MASYLLFILDSRDEVLQAKSLNTHDPADAERLALELCSEACAVEIWRDYMFVGTVRAPAIPDKTH